MEVLCSRGTDSQGHIDQTAESSLCRMCGEKGESVCQLVSK